VMKKTGYAVQLTTSERSMKSSVTCLVLLAVITRCNKTAQLCIIITLMIFSAFISSSHSSVMWNSSIQNYICFLPLETNAVFSKLGAEDIVSRYDKLLHEWKLMKDAELDFKRVMGLDHDRPLVRCLDSIPPGKNQFFIPFCI